MYIPSICSPIEFKRKKLQKSRYIKVKVEHYFLFMFNPPKISMVVSGIKYICFHLLPVFYLIQPSSKQIICFDFRQQNSVLPIVFYVPWQKWNDYYYGFVATHKLNTYCTMLRILPVCNYQGYHLTFLKAILAKIGL